MLSKRRRLISIMPNLCDRVVRLKNAGHWEGSLVQVLVGCGNSLLRCN